MYGKPEKDDKSSKISISNQKRIEKCICQKSNHGDFKGDFCFIFSEIGSG